MLCYDEWGGFFDHVRPPILADDRASRIDTNNFGQAGFRVPSIVASPYARPGAVDHTVYDHTSILRFLHWRFLGAPAEGPGYRDRFALGALETGPQRPQHRTQPLDPKQRRRAARRLRASPIAAVRERGRAHRRGSRARRLPCLGRDAGAHRPPVPVTDAHSLAGLNEVAELAGYRAITLWMFRREQIYRSRAHWEHVH